MKKPLVHVILKIGDITIYIYITLFITIVIIVRFSNVLHPKVAIPIEKHMIKRGCRGTRHGQASDWTEAGQFEADSGPMT